MLVNFIKYHILKQPLKLAKTHDFCASKNPKLTVVMLHGIASSSATYKRALEYLEGTKSMQNVRFVTFDLLGAGKSYKSKDLDYNYTEQLEALDNSIQALNIKTPLILLGHSMGTLIATRYASLHKKTVSKLILVSPPIFKPEDFDNPEFKAGMGSFEKKVRDNKLPATLVRAFRCSMDEIVLDSKNYAVLAKIKTPATLIYGDEDKIIAIQNIPGILKLNKSLSAIKTSGKHGVSREKYVQILKVLEEEIYAKNL